MIAHPNIRSLIGAKVKKNTAQRFLAIIVINIIIIKIPAPSPSLSPFPHLVYVASRYF